MKRAIVRAALSVSAAGLFFALSTPVKAAGKPVQLIVGKGYNHYEVGETLGNPYAILGRAALEMMKLA